MSSDQRQLQGGGDVPQDPPAQSHPKSPASRSSISVGDRQFPSSLEFAAFLRAQSTFDRIRTLRIMQDGIRQGDIQAPDTIEAIWRYVECDGDITLFASQNRGAFRRNFEVVLEQVDTTRKERIYESESFRRLLDWATKKFVDTVILKLTNGTVAVLDKIVEVQGEQGLDPLVLMLLVSTIRLHRLAGVGPWEASHERGEVQITVADVSHLQANPHAVETEIDWQDSVRQAIEDFHLHQIPGGLYTTDPLDTGAADYDLTIVDGGRNQPDHASQPAPTFEQNTSDDDDSDSDDSSYVGNNQNMVANIQEVDIGNTESFEQQMAGDEGDQTSVLPTDAQQNKDSKDSVAACGHSTGSTERNDLRRDFDSSFAAHEDVSQSTSDRPSKRLKTGVTESYYLRSVWPPCLRSIVPPPPLDLPPFLSDRPTLELEDIWLQSIVEPFG